MKQLVVDLGERSYPIIIGNNLLTSKSHFSSLLSSSQILIVTNSTIEPLYLQHLLNVLSDYNVITHVIEDGESYKTLDTMEGIITHLLELKFDRSCCLIALGGGVIGDITGFSSACYQRGVDFIQVPTTLLAQVDSSVGGKTAVNHKLGKNMIGAFHQPKGVIADISLLRTLPERELRAGLAEVIKYGLIRDPEFYIWLESNIEKLLICDPDSMEYAIERSCRNKTEIVTTDEMEKGERAKLNLGHTFGHAIETGLNYKYWLHGEAVGLGMLMAAELSCRTGHLSSASVDRIKTLLQRVNLPVRLPEEFRTLKMRELMSVDKKYRDGRLYLILLEEIGKAIITDQYEEQNLQDTIDYFTPAPGED